MKIKDATIREMAELLLCEQLCFMNTITGKFEAYPSQMDFFADEENPWQEVLDQIDANRDQYICIEPMSSTQSYAVMEAFANHIETDAFRNTLLAALGRPKPFQNFNYLIHDSDFRQAWFNFQEEQTVKWVREQLTDAFLT